MTPAGSNPAKRAGVTDISSTVVGAVAVAALSTFGDFVWANWRVRNLVLYGVLHGMVIFLAIGLVLGRANGRSLAGALAGVVAGAAAAGSYYVMAPLIGYGAMFVAWMLVWMALGVITFVLRVLHSAPPGMDRVGRVAGVVFRDGIGRGVLAAVTSGAAFYAVSGMWRPFDPQGWDYVDHFARWTVAYLPGFASLLVGRNNRSPTA